MIDNQVNNIVRSLNADRGDRFFSTITEGLGKAVEADGVFILKHDELDKRLVGVACYDRRRATFDDSRCETPVFSIEADGSRFYKHASETECCFSGDLGDHFPNDPLLIPWRASSAVAFPLVGSNKKTIGLLAVLFGKPIEDCNSIKSLCLLFSGFIAGQLERETLGRHHQLVASIVANAAEGIVLCNHRKEILHVNSSFEHITGYCREAVLAKPISMLASGYHDRDFYQSMWSSINTRGSWAGEIWNRRASGQVYPEWLEIKRIDSDSSSPHYYVGFFSDISERKRTEKALNYQRNFDILTGLPNRVLFSERCDQLIAESEPGTVAVVMLDIDNFREVNDSFGVEFGNKLLKSLADRLQELVPPDDVFARFHADQFLFAVADIRCRDDINIWVGELFTKLSRPFTVDERYVSLSGRIGISWPNPGDDTSGAQMMAQADQALGHIEKSNKQHFLFYSPDMQTRALRRMHLKCRIEKGLEEAAFSLVYQPIVEKGSSRANKFEVLLRWFDEGRWISPAEFIPVAEEFGLIKAIGDWVLDEACRQLSELHRQGFDDLVFSVNRSVHEFPSKGEDAALWLETLERYHLDPGAICFEITESVLAPEAGSEIQVFDALKAAGCSLAIDDFGTGYSSLSYLRNFAVDFLKIDRCFVSAIDENRSDYLLVKSIIAMAHALGLRVVAEGVESITQVKLLNSLGCDYIQGYFYGKPMSAEEVGRYLWRDA